MHSCDTLVGYWNPNPEKSAPTAVFSSPPNRAAARPAGRCEHTSFQPVNSPVYQRPQGRAPTTCGVFGKAAKRPLPRGKPQQADFTGFRQGENRKIAKCHHFALLATTENG